jgi:hypothetical protein
MEPTVAISDQKILSNVGIPLGNSMNCGKKLKQLK